MNLSEASIVHVCAWPYALWHFRLPLLRLQSRLFKRMVICVPEREYVGQSGHFDGLKREGFTIRVTEIGRNPSFSTPADILHLARYFAQDHFDLVMAHQPMGALVGLTAATLVGIPLRIYSTGGLRYMPDVNGVKNRFLQMGEAGLIAMADAVFSVNQADADYIEACPFGKGKAHVVGPRGGCGYASERFNNELRTLSREKARSELGVARESFLIGFVGRCIWEKGIGELVEAASILRDALPARHLVFVILGSGNDMEDFKALVHRHALDDSFMFLGFRHNIEYWLAALDAFALPSYREGLPTSLLEALAMGIPCVATDIRGCRELVLDGYTGLLIPVKDARALAGALHRLADDPAAGKRLGAAGSELAFSRHASDTLLPRTMKLIEELIARL